MPGLSILTETYIKIIIWLEILRTHTLTKRAKDIALTVEKIKHCNRVHNATVVLSPNTTTVSQRQNASTVIMQSIKSAHVVQINAQQLLTVQVMKQGIAMFKLVNAYTNVCHNSFWAFALSPNS